MLIARFYDTLAEFKQQVNAINFPRNSAEYKKESERLCEEYNKKLRDIMDDCNDCKRCRNKK